MKEIKEFKRELKKLAAKAPRVSLELPKNTVGLPSGMFDLGCFLRYVADCLGNKKP